MSRERELLNRCAVSFRAREICPLLLKDISKLLAQLEQEDGYAWSTVADYEKEVGFKVNDVFKAAWDMARTRLSYESTTQNAGGS
jgi:hypothetical protein